MLFPPRPTRPFVLLALLAGGGCILVSRFDDVSGGPPDAGDINEAGTLDGLTDAAVEAGVDAGPGCACVLETLVQEPGAVPTSLAVDGLENTVYWTNDHVIETCPASGCAKPFAFVDAQAPHAIAVGVSHLAWVDDDSAIWVLPKSQIDGGTPIKVANTVDVSARALTIDDRQPQARIVFMDQSWIYSCPPVRVPSGLSSDCDGQMIAYGINAGRGLVLDGRAYYYVAHSSGADRIFRCGAAGCGNSPDVLATAVGSPQQLAQDLDGLYWIEATGFDGGAILRAPKVADSGGPDVLVGGLAQPEALAVDESSIFFTDLRENAVRRLTKDGGTLATVAASQSAPRLITLDATYVYWANQGDGTIRRAPKCARCP
jgi:hypothetical protein